MADSSINSMILPIMSAMFMNNNSTDNNFCNILYLVLMFVLQGIFQYKIELLEIFKKYINVIYFNKNKTLVYNITGKISYKNNTLWNDDISNKFKAVIYDLEKILSVDKSGTEYSIDEICLNKYVKDSLKFITINTKGKYKIGESLFIETYKNEEASHKEDNKYVTYTLSLLSTIYSTKDINTYIDKCVETYTNEKVKKEKKQHTFVFNSITKDGEELEFEEIEFNTTKSFNNMFFEQKTELVNRLDYFTNNVDKYKRLGIPHTLGFLLYGIPGTGKTSCIKSIAKYTNRHVIILPVKKIKSINILKKIFYSTEINGQFIPNDKRLYVFEEIDCGQWKNIVKSRHISDIEKEKKENKEILTSDVAQLVSKLNSTSISSVANNTDDDITLGDFLELLDGIIEIPNRMLIMTTNHVERLDSALLRAGRLDMIVEFKKMTREDIGKMYNLWFDKSIPNNVYDHIKDYQFTQADIGKMFIKTNIKEIHKCLTKV